MMINSLSLNLITRNTPEAHAGSPDKRNSWSSGKIWEIRICLWVQVRWRKSTGWFVCFFGFELINSVILIHSQIHLLEDGKVLIFSRNQENNTSKYPDVTSRITGSANAEGKVTSAIIDAEVVAWDSVNKHILPFQVLSTRKRKVVCNVVSQSVFFSRSCYKFYLNLNNFRA